MVGSSPSSPLRLTQAETHVDVYVVQFTECTDEVEAMDLDEACTIADCLAPHGQVLVSVSGPDGTRLLVED